MKLSEARQLLERIGAHGGDPDLVVTVQSEGGLGGTPSVAVAGIHAGIDWDSGKVLISTERVLTGLSAEDIEAIRASVRQGGSWHAYQAHKRLRERIAELERQLAEARAAVK
ncbi:MAG: hypothetical protein ACYCUE_06785 [Steroidobacteraceae bacterium]